MDKVIIGILAAIVIFYIVVYVVLPILGVLIGIGLALLAGIAAIGFFSGMIVGFNNFINVLFEAHNKLP